VRDGLRASFVGQRWWGPATAEELEAVGVGEQQPESEHERVCERGRGSGAVAPCVRDASFSAVNQVEHDHLVSARSTVERKVYDVVNDLYAVGQQGTRLADELEIELLFKEGVSRLADQRFER